MKKIFLLFLLTFSLVSFSFNPIKENKKNSSELNCRYGQCQAIAASTGNQCRHCVSNNGDWYCWQHK